MSAYVMVGIDLLAIAILTLGLYFPRHRRRDLVVAYLAVNVGVLAVTIALGSGAVGVGLGLGLFGVLSIIRLRSAELDQQEVAYYFVALALGLVSGVSLSPAWIAPALAAAMLAALWVGDHPRLFGRYRTQTVTVDRAYGDEAALRGHLEQLLAGRVHRLRVRRVDLVNDTTTVEVRFEVPDRSQVAPLPEAQSPFQEVGR